MRPLQITSPDTCVRIHANTPDAFLHHVVECIKDGKGYPKRLKGVNIPLGARIIAVANYYDRFINPCEQNWSKTKKEAVKELNNIAGTVLDPEVVRAFINALG